MMGVRRPAVREVTREDGTKCKRFEGYALVFDEPSVVMCDWWEGRAFREYIDKGAVTQEMCDKQDVICTAFHDREKLLARSVNGEGSMKMTVDETGVKCEFEFDERSAIHNDIMVAVERGDMPGMSFSFYEDDYTYIDSKGADGIIDRHITNLASFFEVTVAANPAYPATTASCKREWEELTKSEEELLRRQKEEQEARHQLARVRESEARQREIELARALDY